MKEKILNYIAEADYEEAARYSAKLTPEELSEIIKEVDDEKLNFYCDELPPELLADALLLLDTENKEDVIDSLQDDTLESVMDELTTEETVTIIKDLSYPLAYKLAEAEEILALLEEKNFSLLRPLLAGMNSVDLAVILEEMEMQDLIRVFRLLPKDLAAETFVEMSSSIQEELVLQLTNSEIKNVLDELFLDDVVDFIEEMPANVVKKILAQSDNETRKQINEILQYPEDSAGSIMTVEYVCLHSSMTVKESIDIIRKKAIDKETIYTCYVTDNTNKLIGVLTAKDLLINDENLLIDDIMNENVIYSYTEDDKENVAQKFSKYGFLAIPIVDREKRLVGIVTIDDAIEVLEEETSEDISMMNAMLPTDKTYMETSIAEICKTRIIWLLVLLISSTFTGLIIANFEGKLSLISPLLFACVPMMMGTGGNAGSQSSVTIIRGLALNEFTIKDIFKILWKEIRVSIILGLILAIACFGKLLLIDKLLFNQPYTIMICFVVSFALFITVVVAKIVGATLPLIAKSCKLDPAVVASPFITTIVDAISLILYCMLAISILA